MTEPPRPLWTIARIGSGQQSRAESGRHPLYGANGIIGTTDVSCDVDAVLVGRVGSVGVVTLPTQTRWGASDNVLVARVDTHIIEPRWLAYWLSTLDWAPHLAGTAQPLLTGRLLGEARVPGMDVRHQRRIADYLDGETARIDSLLERGQRSKALLDERFLSAVAQAVAGGGTHEVVGMYGSSYWVGRVPGSWAVAPLGARYRVELGKMLNTERSQGEDQRPYLGNANVRWDSFELNDLKTMSFTDAEWDRYGVEPGDVLVCEGGEIGRAAVWGEGPTGVHFQKALHRLRPHVPHHEVPRFVMYALMVAAKTGVFEAGSSKATIDHLTGEKLAEHRFPFPPVHDQRSIVAHLDRLAEETRRLSAAVDRQMDLLRERRSALITAAVTGELEV